jgi:hypothetical protein
LQQGPSQPKRLALLAEALRPVEVRHAVTADPLNNRRQTLLRIGYGVADQDPKAISAQVPRPKLVPVPFDPKQPNTATVQVPEPIFNGDRHRYHLPRHGVAVLESRRADFTRAESEAPGDLAAEMLGAHAAFFDPQEKKVAGTGAIVGRDLFDLEILGFDFDSAADARQVGCPVWRRREWLE